MALHPLSRAAIRRAGSCALIALFACQTHGNQKTADAGATRAADSAPASFADEVDALVRDAERATKGARRVHGLVAVARGGDVVHAKSYGLDATLDTRFALASVTKPLTAACVLSLVDRGKWQLSSAASTFVPGLPKGITLEHLLSHTSGIRSYTDDATLMRTRTSPHSPRDIVRWITAQPLSFAPGTRFAYSNSNYYLLGAAIEKVTGLTFEKALLELVLSRAGMTRTTLAPSAVGDDEIAGSTVNDAGEPCGAPAVDPSFGWAALGVRSTARDLLRLDRALAGSLLSRELYQRMITPGAGGYGLGWDIWNEAGQRVCSHEGGIDGFSAFFGRAEDAGVAVVVLLAADALCDGGISAGELGPKVLALALRAASLPSR